ncbi:MAG: hypothetical protein FWG97_04510 [Deltaproteobacteria bacterium]|nr:hypothetical protein [Deltaproteobacteria bacterium]
MTINLNNFYIRATDTFKVIGSDNLRVENDKVFFAGKESSQEANRNAMSAFLKSLRAEYGDAFADMLTNKYALTGHLAQGKPLTTRMVVDLVRAAREESRLLQEHNSRMESARQMAEPLLDLEGPDGPGVLIGAWKSAGALYPGAHFSMDTIKRVLTGNESLKEGVIRRVSAEIAQSGKNPSQDKIREFRDAAVAGYFKDLKTLGEKADAYLQGFSVNILTNEAKEAKRNDFIRACLDLGELPRPEFVPAIMNMAGLVSTNIEALKGAGHWRGAETLMNNLYGSIKADFINHEAFKGKDMGDFSAPLLAAMRLGLGEVAGRHGDEVFARILTRPGGPYRDFIHGLAHHAPGFGKKAEHAFHPCLLIQKAMGPGGLIGNEALEKETQARLNPDNIRQRDLSVARQRELQGGVWVYITPGAGEVPPGLGGAIGSLPEALKNDKEVQQYYIGKIQEEIKGLGLLKKANVFLSKAMGDIKNHIANDVAKGMIKPLSLYGGLYGGGSVPGGVDSGLDGTFVVDYGRDGVYVDGIYHHPNKTGASFTDFKNRFPDAYTAETLSKIANQKLAGSTFMQALLTGLERRLGPDAADYFYQRVLNNFSLRDGENNDVRIETLDSKSGLYRITASYCKSTKSNFSDGPLFIDQTASMGIERVMYEVAVDVKLGPPMVGEGPRIEPSVKNVRVDFLVRGRDAVPGEEDDTPEAVKRALAEPPQKYKTNFVVEKNIGDKIRKLEKKANKAKAQPPNQGGPQPPNQVNIQQPPNQGVPQGPLAAVMQPWSLKGHDQAKGSEAAVSMWLGNLMGGGKALASLPKDMKACQDHQKELAEKKPLGEGVSWYVTNTLSEKLIVQQLTVNIQNDPAKRVFFDGSSNYHKPAVLKGEGAQGFGWVRDSLSPRGGFAVLSASDPDVKGGGKAMGIFREGDNFWVFDPAQGLCQTDGARLDKFLSQCGEGWPRVEATLGQVVNLLKPTPDLSELKRNAFELAWMGANQKDPLFKKILYSGNSQLERVEMGLRDGVLNEFRFDETLGGILEKAEDEAKKPGGVSANTGDQLMKLIGGLATLKLGEVWKNSSSGGDKAKNRIPVMLEALYNPDSIQPSPEKQQVRPPSRLEVFAKIKATDKLTKLFDENKDILSTKPAWTGAEILKNGLDQGLGGMPPAFKKMWAGAAPALRDTILDKLGDLATRAIDFKFRDEEEIELLLKRVSQEQKKGQGKISSATGGELQALVALMADGILNDVWAKFSASGQGAQRGMNFMDEDLDDIAINTSYYPTELEPWN